MAYEYMTLSELTKGLGNEDITNVVDEITKSTTMLADAPFAEASGMLENRGMRKLTLPGYDWVAIDQGGKSYKGSKELFVDDLGIAESWSTARQKEGMFAPNPEKVYAADEKDHVGSLAMGIESCLVYGGDKPQQFKGLAPRFNKITTDFTVPSFITLDNAGDTDGAQSSMYLIVWGENAATMLHPRFVANKGIQITKGGWQVITENNEKFFQRDTQFLMTTGLALMNRFAVIRIANIDATDSGLETSMPKLKKNLFKAFTLLPQQFKSRVRIYTSGSVIAGLNDYYDGKVSPVTYEGAIPTNAIGDVRFDKFVIRQCDSMNDAENVVA